MGLGPPLTLNPGIPGGPGGPGGQMAGHCWKTEWSDPSQATGALGWPFRRGERDLGPTGLPGEPDRASFSAGCRVWRGCGSQTAARPLRASRCLPGSCVWASVQSWSRQLFSQCLPSSQSGLHPTRLPGANFSLGSPQCTDMLQEEPCVPGGGGDHAVERGVGVRILLWQSRCHRPPLQLLACPSGAQPLSPFWTIPKPPSGTGVG